MSARSALDLLSRRLVRRRERERERESERERARGREREGESERERAREREKEFSTVGPTTRCLPVDMLNS